MLAYQYHKLLYGMHTVVARIFQLHRATQMEMRLPISPWLEHHPKQCHPGGKS